MESVPPRGLLCRNNSCRLLPYSRTYASRRATTCSGVHVAWLQIDAAVEAGLPGGLLDVSEAISAPLSDDMLSAMAPRSEAVQRLTRQGARMLSQRFLVTAELLCRCEDGARQAGAAAAERDLLQPQQSGSSGAAGVAAQRSGGAMPMAPWHSARTGFCVFLGAV